MLGLDQLVPHVDGMCSACHLSLMAGLEQSARIKRSGGDISPHCMLAVTGECTVVVVVVVLFVYSCCTIVQ